MRTKKTTLSFLTESKSSAVGFSSMRRVAMTLLVMLLTTASAIAENYTLTLDANYEGGVSRMISVSGFTPTYTLTQSDVPIREGHTFCGWSETPTGDAAYFTGNAVTLSGNLTLYAIWDKIYTLTLDANYEGGVSRMIPVTSFSPTYRLLEDVEPTREGHIFCGWSETPAGSYQYSTGDIITLSGDLTLYAIWDDSPCPYRLRWGSTEGAGTRELSGVDGYIPGGKLDIPANITIDDISYPVTRIGDYALVNRSSLEYVTIPNSVRSIGTSAFKSCGNLKSVTIPNSVTSIEYDAFKYCSSLESVTIPNSVTSIGNDAFSCCSSLQSVTIPNSVTSIGNRAFQDCSSLQSVTINGNPKIGTDAFWRVHATVTMNLTASPIDRDYWTTFYNNGYNFEADENTTVYKGTVDGSSLVLTEVEDKIVNSGTAVILKSSGNPVMTLTYSESSDTNGNNLRGISDRTLRTSVISDFSANEIYTMGNTSVGFGFHKYTGEFVPAGKAFLPLNTSNGAKAQSLTIVFAIGATGINSVSSDSNEQNDWFSLDGTRLNGKPSQPGIYVNGKKKVVIK